MNSGQIYMILISRLNVKLKSIDQSNNQLISQLNKQPFDLSYKAICVTNDHFMGENV